jgi:bacillithiol biosynthesis cysteine-adding enzyme BshC
MIKNSYSFSEFNFSSKIIRDLVDKKDKVKPFITDFFSIDKLKIQIDEKRFSNKKRKDLYQSLLNQNIEIELSVASKKNIELVLEDNTFTTTTGHQLNLMSGPLYSIYKIIQVIVWSQEMKSKLPDFNFVPVFWMATEDHDFEEINHIHLFNSKIEWNKIGQEDFITGKVITNEFNKFEEQVLSKFSDEIIRTKVEKYLSYYNSTNLSKATRLLLNDLFGEYGLVIIDGDDKRLKQGFSDAVKRELSESVTFKSVTNSNLKLDQAGYHNQVHLRECNLFYIDENSKRHRIVKVEDGFQIDSIFYNDRSLLELGAQFPERFSPNALMRPVYQETILPNLVYFGGGGEIAYWLQLKDLFDELDLAFPLLRVRDSYVLLSEKQTGLMAEFKYSVLDLKQNMDDLAKAYTKVNAKSDISMIEEFSLFENLRIKLNSKVVNSDLGVKRFVEGELVRIESQLEKIEKKLIQSEKKNLEQSIKQIQKLKDKIYPLNGFQERYENILQYISNDNFIQTIKKEAEQSLTVQPQIKVFKI